MTKEQIQLLLSTNAMAVERAILALYSRQTSDEQSAATTQHRNGRGFNAFHAKSGSYYARWLQRGNHLTGHHLDSARQMVRHYVGQLVEVSQARLASCTVHAIEGSLAEVDPFQVFHGKGWRLSDMAPNLFTLEATG